jgi:uncharacterized membrane protein YhiD involved in acid resistance
MPTPISTEVWATIAQWIVYGSSVGGAVMAIAKFVSWLRSKSTIAKIEEDVKKHSELLEKDNQRIKALEQQTRDVESDLKDMHVLLRLNTKAQQAIMKSLLDGNNKDNIQKVSNEIQNYLNEQI